MPIFLSLQMPSDAPAPLAPMGDSMGDSVADGDGDSFWILLEGSKKTMDADPELLPDRKPSAPETRVSEGRPGHQEDHQEISALIGPPRSIDSSESSPEIASIAHPPRALSGVVLSDVSEGTRDGEATYSPEKLGRIGGGASLDHPNTSDVSPSASPSLPPILPAGLPIPAPQNQNFQNVPSSDGPLGSTNTATARDVPQNTDIGDPRKSIQPGAGPITIIGAHQPSTSKDPRQPERDVAPSRDVPSADSRPAAVFEDLRRPASEAVRQLNSATPLAAHEQEAAIPRLPGETVKERFSNEGRNTPSRIPDGTSRTHAHSDALNTSEHHGARPKGQVETELGAGTVKPHDPQHPALSKVTRSHAHVPPAVDSVPQHPVAGQPEMEAPIAARPTRTAPPQAQAEDQAHPRLTVGVSAPHPASTGAVQVLVPTLDTALGTSPPKARSDRNSMSSRAFEIRQTGAPSPIEPAPPTSQLVVNVSVAGSLQPHEVTLAPTSGGDSADISLPGAPAASTVSSASPPSAPPLPPTAISQTAFQHMATAVSATPNGSLEIALHPEELGQVRLVLSSLEGGATLFVSAEREDTLHLLRRHEEALLRAFVDIGYEELSLAFEQFGQQTETPSEEPDEGPGTEVAVNPVEEIGHAPRTGDLGRLDLRL